MSEEEAALVQQGREEERAEILKQLDVLQTALTDKAARAKNRAEAATARNEAYGVGIAFRLVWGRGQPRST